MQHPPPASAASASAAATQPGPAPPAAAATPSAAAPSAAASASAPSEPPLDSGAPQAAAGRSRKRGPAAAVKTRDLEVDRLSEQVAALLAVQERLALRVEQLEQWRLDQMPAQQD